MAAQACMLLQERQILALSLPAKRDIATPLSRHLCVFNGAERDSSALLSWDCG